MNRIIFKEGIPFIEDSTLNPKGNLASVYFPVEGEQYYLVVSLVLEAYPMVRGVAISAGNDVYFSATSEMHRLEELLALITFEPTRTRKRKIAYGEVPRNL